MPRYGEIRGLLAGFRVPPVAPSGVGEDRAAPIRDRRDRFGAAAGVAAMNKHLGAVSGQAQGNRAAEARRRTRHQRLVIPQVAITPVVPFQAVMRGQGEWCRCLLRPIQRIADPRIDPGELASVSDSSGRSPHRLLTPIRQSAPTFDRRLTGSLRSATAAYHTSPSSRSQRRTD